MLILLSLVFCADIYFIKLFLFKHIIVNIFSREAFQEHLSKKRKFRIVFLQINYLLLFL